LELAVTLLQQGKNSEAAEEFARAKQLDPKIVVPAS
jgi:hypothetical protein